MYRLEAPGPDYPGREVVSACFGEDFAAPPGDLVYGMNMEGIVVSHVAVYQKTIRIAGRAVEVAAIAQVGTLPNHRRRGLATALLNAAHDDARERVAFAGLFGPLAFYRRFGYCETNLTDELGFLLCPFDGEVHQFIGEVDLVGQRW